MELARVSLDDLRIGAICKFDIQDDNGLLLLGRGLPLTQTIRDQLRERGVSFLHVHPDDVAALTGAAKAKPAAKKPAAPKVESLRARRADRRDEPYSAERAESFRRIVGAAVSVVAQIGEQIQSSSRPEVSELCEIPNQLTGMLLEDADQSIWAVGESDDLSLPKRCARMSLMAINTGIEMELSEQESAHLGTAGLLHDLGLYLMPAHFRDLNVALGANDVWEYRRHPTLVVNAFAKLSIVSDEVCLIANQVHERLDGSGYPRGLNANVIHPLARILSIVDTYLTLIQPGPKRPAVVPHDAIGFLLYEVGRGLFDPVAMRAFLSQLALFPIGSEVELVTGERATVVRRDGEHYATPIVRIDGAHDGDFIKTSDPAKGIARPTVGAPQEQMRITQNMMPELNLDMFQRAC